MGTHALSFFAAFTLLILIIIGSYFFLSENFSSSEKGISPGVPVAISKTPATLSQVTPSNFEPIQCKVLIPSPHLLGLEDAFEVKGVSTRPDETGAKVRLLLKQSRQEKEVNSNQSFYLRFEKVGEEHCLVFSEDKTAIEGKVFIVSPQGLQVVIAWATPFDQQPQAASFTMDWNSSLRNEENLQSLQTLKQAEYFGRDVFLQALGGEEYASLWIKGMLAFNHKTEQVIYLAEGDYLVWKGSHWQVKPLDEGKGKPIAKVININPHEITLRYWDRTGFVQETFTQRIALPKPSSLALEKLIHDAKLRSSKRVSCIFDGKKTFLSEGDWILRMEDEWKVIRGLNQIQDFLEHRIKGDLLVLSKVVITSTECYLEVLYFNPQRTLTKTLKVPVYRLPRKEPVSTKRKKFEEKMKWNLNGDTASKDKL